MSTINEYKAQREAEWAIAKAGDPAVKAALALVDAELAMMLWMLGWQQGALTTKSEHIRELQAATDRAMGKR